MIILQRIERIIEFLKWKFNGIKLTIYGGRNMIIGKCSCCGKIKFIFKNKDDGGYDQSMCAKCYENSWKFAEEFHKNNKKQDKITFYKDVKYNVEIN